MHTSTHTCWASVTLVLLCCYVSSHVRRLHIISCTSDTVNHWEKRITTADINRHRTSVVDRTWWYLLILVCKATARCHVRSQPWSNLRLWLYLISTEGHRVCVNKLYCKCNRKYLFSLYSMINGLYKNKIKYTNKFDSTWHNIVFKWKKGTKVLLFSLDCFIKIVAHFLHSSLCP